MKFTILLAVHNRLELLKESIISAINQTYSDYEVLVIDDGSGAETKGYLRTLKSDRLRIIFKKNEGVAKARQAGLNEAKGHYVVILDSDDQLVTDALDRFNEYIEEYPNTDVFYCNNIETKDNDCKKFKSDYPSFRNNKNFIRSIFTRPRVPFKHSGMVYKTEMARGLGGYDVTLANKIDIDLMLKFLTSGKKVKLIPQYLVYFKMHSNSISYQRIEGIPTWNFLIQRYANGSLYYVLVRDVIELLKYLYSRVRR